MLSSNFKRLCIFLPSIISALPLDTTASASPTSLPSSIQNSVPACAQSCLASSLSREFPLSCTSSFDLDCLCSQYSSTGESLGEVALGCVYASCSTVDEGAASAYNICLGRKSAVSPTQTALTVTAGPSTSMSTIATSVPTTSSMSTSVLRSTLSTSVQSSTVAPASVLAASVTALPSTPTSTSTSTPTSTGTSAGQTQVHRGLSPAQIVGIAVAAAATLILALGLMLLSICLRRRHERKEAELIEKAGPEHAESKPRQSRPRFSRGIRFSMSQKKPNSGPARQKLGVGVAPVPMPKGPPVRPYIDPYSLPALPRINTAVQRPGMNEARVGEPTVARSNAERSSRLQPAIPIEEIGIAISPETPRHVSPQSVASTNTVSRLLPDKPVPVLRAPRVPQRTQTRRPLSVLRRPDSTMLRPDSVVSQATVFEEDASESRRVSEIPPQPAVIPPFRKFQPPRAEQPPYTSTLPPRVFADRQPLARQPELFLDIPVRHSKTLPAAVPSPVKQSRTGPNDIPVDQSGTVTGSVPSPFRQVRPGPKPITIRGRTPSSEALADRTLYKSSSSSSSSLDMSHGGYIPDYYISPEKLLPRPEKVAVTSERYGRPRKSPKIVEIKSKSSLSSASGRTSRASESGRDSRSSNTSFETVDPDDPTPEHEEVNKPLSPVAESPISNLRYPKVPRASNQYVPRSPPASARNSKDMLRTQAVSPTPSLLAKRRGEKRAHELEVQLWAGTPSTMSLRSTESAHRHRRSVSDGRARITSQGSSARFNGPRSASPTTFEMGPIRPLHVRKGQPPEMEALKSPLWVPRLTPTRKGDDLFISVA